MSGTREAEGLLSNYMKALGSQHKGRNDNPAYKDIAWKKSQATV